MSRRGAFVVVEGIKSCGKSAVAERLRDRLDDRQPNRTSRWTREPTQSPIGLFIAKRLADDTPPDPRELLHLLLADRIAHARQINAWLDEGRMVVCERYILSSLVYQADAYPRSTIVALHAGLPVPDLTLVLDLPVDVAMRRRRAQRKAVDVHDALERQRVARGRYLAEAIAAHAAGQHVEVIDASTEVLDAVVAECWEHVEPLLARAAPSQS